MRLENEIFLVSWDPYFLHKKNKIQKNIIKICPNKDEQNIIIHIYGDSEDDLYNSHLKMQK